MKKLTPFLLTALAITCVVACSPKKEESTTATEEKTATEEWAEMDAFHIVMAETFHPFKDSANLEPVKAQAQELIKAADAWLAAPLPEKVNNDEVKAKLQDLKTSSEALAQLVTAGTTEQIGASLTSLHDKFHALQEAWYGAGEDKHDHKHEH
jgi:hypothetical protein